MAERRKVVPSSTQTTASSTKKKGLFSRFRKKKTPPPPPPSSPRPTRKTSSTQNIVSATPRQVEKEKEQPKGNWLSRTTWFRNMCKSSFQVVDQDGSGTVDPTELYSGLLLIHLKLGTYAGPAACRPLDRERCQKVFKAMDEDGSGTLDQEEFAQVMMVLFSNVLLRVMAQWSLTLMIVPLVAQYILDAIYWLIAKVYEIVTELDEHAEIFNEIELAIEGAWAWVLEKTPPFILTAASTVKQGLDYVPDSVWNTIPLTLLSTILGLLVVPWTIMKIDDFFQDVADPTKKQNKVAKKTK